MIRLFKLRRFLKPYKLQVILGPLFKLVEAVFELIIPLIMAKVIDTGVKNNNIQYVFKMGAFMILLGIVGLCSTIVCQSFAAKASQGFGTNLRNSLFEHINTFSHKELDKFESGALITRMTNDVNQLQLAVAMFIRLAIRAPFLIIGSMIMAVSISMKMSVIFFITSVVISLSLYFIITGSVPFLKKIQSKLDRLALITREDLDGTRVIRAFSKQKWSIKRFKEINNEISFNACEVAKISSLLNPITYVIINLGIVAIIWYGGVRVNTGDITQGEIIAFVNYMTQILLALIVVSNLVIIFTKAFASAGRINEIFDTKTSIKEKCGLQEATVKNDKLFKIEFKDVSFSYDKNSEPSIKNVNVSIKSGERIGIIGGTGSGKSTFINLIPRFYDVSSGAVYVDGVNIKNYNTFNLRKKIAIVHQRSVLFSGTVRENLKLGKKDATDNELYEALRVAQALDFVNEKPKGLNEIIEQDGKNFSGGQRQRLTIARALVKKPEILILDDSSSALDYNTEANFRKSLIENTKGITVITVSQRATSIKHCDKIIVFDEGKILGIGKHEELIKSCSVYREICKSQTDTEAS